MQTPHMNQSLIQPIKLHQPFHDLNHLIPDSPTRGGIQRRPKRRVIYPAGQRLIQHHTETRNKNADAGPATKPQPAVDDEPAAHCIQVNGATEEEQGVGVER